MSTWLSIVAVVLAAGALVAAVAIPGPAGSQGNTGATGNTGPQGPPGTSYSVNATLRTGENETGVYGAWGNGSADGSPVYFGGSATFWIPLRADIPVANVAFIPLGQAYTLSCPGPGRAASGHLCVYEGWTTNSVIAGIANPVTGFTGCSRFGFVIYFAASGPGTAISYGSYTVTAP